MLRWLFTMVSVALLVAPAAAYDVIWQGEPEGDIDINLQLDCYIQIEWQDTEIHFDGASDWWSTQLMGLAYAACPDDGGKNAADPWAGDTYYAGAGGRYFESGDGGVIFVRSNNDLSMFVHTNGDLAGTINDPSNTIPTWFTVALCPFQIGGVPLSGHNIPFCGHPGCYLSPGIAGAFAYCDPGYNFPSQWAFPCDPASQTWQLGSMSPYIEGTIKFLARIHRHGMQDFGDHYYTHLDVWFTTP